MSSRELKLLCLFIKNPSVALSRDKIAREVMGHAFSAESRVVDVLVSDLRLKLQAAQAAARQASVQLNDLAQSADIDSYGATARSQAFANSLQAVDDTYSALYTALGG